MCIHPVVLPHTDAGALFNLVDSSRSRPHEAHDSFRFGIVDIEHGRSVARGNDQNWIAERLGSFVLRRTEDDSKWRRAPWDHGLW